MAAKASTTQRDRNDRHMRHSVVSCFAIVGGFLACVFYGLWAVDSGMPLGWRFLAIGAGVAVAGAVLASLPVRFCFWLVQRPRRAKPERR